MTYASASQPIDARAHAAARLRGITYMVCAVFVFAIMDAIMKALAAHYGALQVSCMRSLSSLVCLAPLLLSRRSRSELRPERLAWLLLRGLLGIGMLTSFVYGVRHLTLSQTYSLYLTAPLLMTALSVPFFDERVPPRRWIAILVGLSGVLIILRPWDDGAPALLPSAAVLLATLCYAFSALMVRSLSRTQSRMSLVFWYLLLVALGSAALTGREWSPMGVQDWWLIVALGITGMLGQLWLTAAFSAAPPSVVGPFEYTALLWAFGIDRIVWSTSPSLHLIAGALVVVGTGIFVIEDERRMASDTPP